MLGVWDTVEFEYNGQSKGNPFIDYNIYGEFTVGGETKTVSGFYDGEGIYRVRFMPLEEGDYTYKIYGINFNIKSATFYQINMHNICLYLWRTYNVECHFPSSP